MTGPGDRPAAVPQHRPPPHGRPIEGWGPAFGVASVLAAIGVPVSCGAFLTNFLITLSGLVLYPPMWLVVFAVPAILLTTAWLFLRHADQQPEKFRIGVGVLMSPAILIVAIICFGLVVGGLRLLALAV